MERERYLKEILEKTCSKTLCELKRNGDLIPYIPENGHYKDMAQSDITWWTNGFFAGMLWELYNVTGNTRYKEIAQSIERKLDNAIELYEGLNQDVGVMWLLTSVANYKINGEKKSRTRGYHMADVLLGRYNVNGEFLRSRNGEHAGIMSIDSLMNLTLLFWATNETNDPGYASVAKKHADTVLRYLVREDGSCAHTASIDPYTGEFLKITQGYGYSEDSAWARGQAWAVYGFALCYKYTNEERYLQAAMKIACYTIKMLRKNGYISPSDFKAPTTLSYFDSTAGVIAASGILEIAQQLESVINAEYSGVFGNIDFIREKISKYREAAFRIVEATERRFANWNNDEDGIITMGKVSYYGTGKDHHVNIVYGDFFFIEAVIKLLGKDILINKEFNIW